MLSSIGQGIGSAESAIRYHWRGLRAEHADGVLAQCWIITGGAASRKSARDLVSRLIKEDFPPIMFHYADLTAEDADNPEAVHREIDRIFTDARKLYKLPEEEIIADLYWGDEVHDVWPGPSLCITTALAAIYEAQGV